MGSPASSARRWPSWPRLRFGDCASPGADLFRTFDGSRLTSHVFRTGGLYLSPVPPRKQLGAVLKPEEAADAMADPAAPRRVCVDRWCTRCLARGNANAVRSVLCAVSGFEAFVVPPVV